MAPTIVDLEYTCMNIKVKTYIPTNHSHGKEIFSSSKVILDFPIEKVKVNLLSPYTSTSN